MNDISLATGDWRLATSFRMPAEWALQARVWFAWPHNKADWPGKFAPIPHVFAEMVRVITQSGQRVGLIVKNAAHKKVAHSMLKQAHANLKMIDVVEAPTDRGWMRDCGPIWVHDDAGARIALDWGFTAWAKYDNWKKDTAVPASVLAYTGDGGLAPQHRGRQVVLEGGGIDVDGQGSILVTEEWLLSKKQVRNTGFTREDYESIFAHYLGASNTIWLGRGIVGDDTHGHVDDITRFVAPGVIATCIELDKKDENYALLQENRKRLNAARDTQGKPFSIVEIPMPRPVMFDGERLPASYANFLICNRVVLVPTFNDPSDAVALRLLQECFPDRDVVGIFARDLVWGLGTIHCLSQQEPV